MLFIKFILSFGVLLSFCGVVDAWASSLMVSSWIGTATRCPSNRLHQYSRGIQYGARVNRNIKRNRLFLASAGAENGVNLSSLTNFESEGEYLRASIKKWLDVEYIEQDVHAQLGEEVSRIYMDRRSNGVNDLGELLMDIGTALESFDMGDAFVNGWDVANRASDFLMLRMERELCSCAGDIADYQVNEDEKNVR